MPLLSLNQFVRATGLRERHKLRLQPINDSDRNRLDRAWTYWRREAHLTDEVRLKRRLEADELSENFVNACLIGGVPSLNEAPLWFTYLEHTLQQSVPQDIFSEYGQPFAIFIAPFVEEALSNLTKRLSSFSDLNVETVFGMGARRRLGSRLFDLSARVLVLEMHNARKNGELHGENTNERYRSFTEDQTKDRLSKILLDYPVLARLLATTCMYWVEAAVELIERLNCDYHLINELINDEVRLGTLRSAEWGLGDLHHKGRSVWSLSFNGSRLIYKSKNLSVDVAFQKVLGWINEHSTSFVFRPLKLINQDDYGWVEFVHNEPCVDRSGVNRYFHRLGGFICLIHLLEGTDFHSTNIIASNEHPVLIDLEGLFHPRRTYSELETPFDIALQNLSESPLRTGILPVWLWDSEDQSGIDISGVGGAPDQLINQRIWIQTYTDEMRLEIKPQPLGPRPNHVICNGMRVSPEDYANDILFGFQEMGTLLIKFRDHLLSKDSPIWLFETCQTRFIYQDTATYKILQDASLHPNFLRDGIQRDVALDRLWICASDETKYDSLIVAAHKDMWFGDVPYFRTCANSKDVVTSEGIIISGLFRSTSFEKALERLRGMTMTMVEQHSYLIRSSLAMLAKLDLTVPNQPLVETSKNEANWLDAACSIGQELLDTAIHSQGGATWIGLNFAAQKWRLEPLPVTLYNGLSGIALFLNCLAKQSGEQRFADLCDESLRSIEMQLAETRTPLIGVGAFTGWSSLLYTYTNVAVLRDDNSYLSKIDAVLSRIEEYVSSDTMLDWMDGAAGCIAVLLSIYTKTDSERLLELACQYGQHLLKTAKAVKGGLAWLRPGRKIPLAGLAHGASGMALALARLASVTGQEVFMEAAKCAIAYERSIYDTEVRNWPDLREESVRSHMVAWCHGAAGIGMTRLELNAIDEVCLQEVELALSAVRTAGFGRVQCLCHGDFGNLDLLIQAGYVSEARQIATSLMAQNIGKTWVSGTPLQTPTPGLMLGLAGIGMGLLRLHAPDAIPSPLILSLPKRH